MRYAAILLFIGAGLLGCSGGRPSSTCEVMSPPQVIIPSNQDDQRVEAQSSGDPTESNEGQQHCP
ncbi:hypothetical protein E8F20_10475 [Pseudomonas sp. BN415]|uniref:hypothetical protein n=1 Tax=Pseudomonas sp. BN415 TaxID=2567889 RepID=UPI0024580834|nr:hypothetical protein [Pseudomonas sp. BN415]MDH4582294.1 hypothetical protein [Pseudomonas sp. BN415]